MIRAVFFDISKLNNFSNNFDNDGIFFLWWSSARPNSIMLDVTTPPDHTPVSKGSGVTDAIPGMVAVLDAMISAGKITETKLIRTILIEKRNTINGIIA
jgi:hypothetical protein